MDHRSLAKQDKKHVGVSNYNQVKREILPQRKNLIKSKEDMKGNLVNSKWFLSIIVASLLMPLSSCSERRESLSSNTRQSFDITYSKKEIVIESSTKTEKDHFFKKDGEYW